MKRLLMRARRRQQGVGLVELMITLLLGALVVAGVIALFNANRQSFRLQDGLSLAQEQGSFALHFIARDLHRAGYPGDQFSEVSLDIDQSLDNVVMNRVEAVNGVDVNISYEDDQLAVAYMMDSNDANPQMPDTTCTGVAVPAGTEALSNRYWVNDERELVCQGFAITVSAGNVIGRVAVGQPEALISGVESFQVMYGVDTTFDLNPDAENPVGCVDSPQQPTRFVNASQLPALVAYLNGGRPACAREMSPMSSVRAIRIGLLVRTENDVDAVLPADIEYTVLDRTVDAGDMPNLLDGRLRRLFVTTVALRNTQLVIE